MVSSDLSAAPKVALAVATFRHDDAVLALLASVLARPDSPFGRIVVVDSLGTGRIPQEILARGWTAVEYRSFDKNLGSAGNLAERLRLAAATDAEYVFAVNHDGQIDFDTVRRLVAAAAGIERIGAAYPLRRKAAKGGRYDVTGRHSLPLPFVGRRERPKEPLIPVHWSSSNGALYALAPVRAGLHPWADLWMGWEDLGYGWELARHGYAQVVVTDAPIEDPSEYAARKVGPFTIHVSDKPAWYAYYNVRNMILITRRTERPLPVRAAVAGRIALEFCLTTALRSQKRLRYGLLARGAWDGMRNRTGKWRLP